MLERAQDTGKGWAQYYPTFAQNLRLTVKSVNNSDIQALSHGGRELWADAHPSCFLLPTKKFTAPLPQKM